MISASKLKSVDFYRKIPRDLTEASLSGAGLSIIAAVSMIFLFGMELNSYLTVTASTSVIVDKSADGEFLRIEFNISFPALSCEFASVDVSDVLGTNRLNITKTVRKFSIDQYLNPTGSEFHSGPIPKVINHGDETDGEYAEGSVALTSASFDRYAHEYPIFVVNFYAPWCAWSNWLKPAWEKAAKIIRERYDPEMDGRILIGKVDCTQEMDLCKRNHIQGYPSIRIFRKGTDVRDNHGHHEHESYYGERDTDSLVTTMEGLVSPIPLETHKHESEINGTDMAAAAKRRAPSAGGCRVEGFVRVKKVPGNLVISAHSGAHSFDASLMNVSHVISHFSFGRQLTPKLLTEVKRLSPHLGENVDRLTGRAYITRHDDASANVTIEHYLQIVKTEVKTRRHSEKLIDYEYTSHSSLAHSPNIPVAKFHFVPSAMQVLITENEKSFSHFITNVCAIIGGVFTVAGILDSIMHNTMRLMKKMELGKQF